MTELEYARPKSHKPPLLKTSVAVAAGFVIASTGLVVVRIFGFGGIWTLGFAVSTAGLGALELGLIIFHWRHRKRAVL